MLTKLKIEELYEGCTRVSLVIEEDAMKKIAERIHESPKFMWVEDFSDRDNDGWYNVSATHKAIPWLACVGHDEDGQSYVAAQGAFTFGNDDDLDGTRFATEPSSDDILDIAVVIRDLLALSR